MNKILEKVKEETKTRNLRKVSKQLREVLDRVREALELNPDFIPRGKAIGRLKKEAQRAKRKEAAPQKEKPPSQALSTGQEKPKALLVKPEVSRRIRLKHLGVSVGIASLGKESPESIAQGNLIYINQDHPLYQKFYQKPDSFTLYLARLITKEIILMKKLRITAKDAFEAQSTLLTDIFAK